MMVCATAAMVFARSSSIGFSSSLSASSVANRWLRKSSILFCIPLSLVDLALQSALELNDQPDLPRVPGVVAIPAHQLLASHELEVVEDQVLAVAVLEDDDVPPRDWSVLGLPHQYVDGLPISWRIAGIRDLPLPNPIVRDPLGANRTPRMRSLSGFEARLDAAPSSLPMRPLVPGCVAFRESVGRAPDAIEPARRGAGQI